MKNKKYLSSLLSIAFIGIFSACQSQANNVMINQNNNIKEEKMPENKKLPLMKFTPDDYNRIHDGGGKSIKEFPVEKIYFLHNEMSIWMPKVVQYRIKNRKDIKRSSLRLPIAIRIDADSVNSLNIKVTMMNVKTKETYSGIPHYVDPHPIAIDPMKGSYEVEKEPTFPRGVGAFFNYNLLNYLDIPLESATYEVIAELDDMKSKPVKVQIIVE